MSTIPDSPFDESKPQTYDGSNQNTVPLTADQRAQHANGNAAFAAAKTDIEGLEAHPPRTDNPHSVTAAQTGALEDVFTADGDILTHQAGATAKVPIGTAGQVLKVTGGLPSWEDETGGGGSGTVQDIAKDGAVVVSDAVQLDFRESGDATVQVFDAGGGVARITIDASAGAGGGGIGAGTPFVTGDLLAVQSDAGDGTAQSVGFAAADVARFDQPAVFLDELALSRANAVDAIIEARQTGTAESGFAWWTIGADTGERRAQNILRGDGAIVWNRLNDAGGSPTQHMILNAAGTLGVTVGSIFIQGAEVYHPGNAGPWLENVIDDMSPQLGGNLETLGNLHVLQRTDQSVRGLVGASESEDLAALVYSRDATSWEQQDGAVVVAPGRVILGGSSAKVESLQHSADARQVYVSPQGVLYSVDPPPAGWTSSDTSTTTASMGSGDTTGPWVDTGLTLGFLQDVEIGQRLDVSVNCYIENRTDDKPGSISFGFGFNSATPTSAAATVTIGEYFEGWVPVSFSTTADQAWTTADDIGIFVRRESSEDSNFNPWIAYEGTVPHEGILSTPGSSGGGGSSTWIGLTDTPASYPGDVPRIVQLNAGLDGVEFGAPVANVVTTGSDQTITGSKTFGGISTFNNYNVHTAGVEQAAAVTDLGGGAVAIAADPRGRNSFDYANATTVQIDELANPGSVIAHFDSAIGTITIGTGVTEIGADPGNGAADRVCTMWKPNGSSGTFVIWTAA